MSAAIRHDGFSRDLHARVDREASTEKGTDAEVERASMRRQEPPADEASRRSTALESAIHGAVMQARSFPPFGLPSSIDGSSEGGGWTHDQTVDGKRLDRATLAVSLSAGAVISREVTIGDSGETMDQIVIQATGADDDIQVSQRDDGSLDVTINGQTTNIVLEPGQELAIRTGDGNDRVTVDAGVEANIDADLGNGDDTIHANGAGNDRIEAGDGSDTIVVSGGGPDGGDYVDGGRGNDTIRATGGGSNAVYGGRGSDDIEVDGDNNYVDAGRDDDRVRVDGNTNVVGGGRGDDRIESKGDNTIYTGRGSDSVDVREGNATVYGQFGVFDFWNRDSVTVRDGATAAREQVDLSMVAQDPPVNVEGSQEFRDRVESDLDFLEASPAGQQMFDEFRRARADGNEVTISELQNERNGSASPQGDRGFIGEDSEGEGVGVRINYNAEHFKYGDDYHSPLITLYHEMSHAYNGVTGTYQPDQYDGPGNHVDDGVNNRERQAVGLETSNDPYDYDGNPLTPPTTHNPYDLTENGMRDEMGVPTRDSYR